MVYVNNNLSAERPFHFCGPARYANSIVAKYLDTATVKVRNRFYKTTLPADMIFTKEVFSTSEEQVESLTREYNIHYRACIGSLIYLLSTRVDLSFSVHKLAKFSANPGKVHFEGLVHLLTINRSRILCKLCSEYYILYSTSQIVHHLWRHPLW